MAGSALFASDFGKDLVYIYYDYFSNVVVSFCVLCSVCLFHSPNSMYLMSSRNQILYTLIITHVWTYLCGMGSTYSCIWVYVFVDVCLSVLWKENSLSCKQRCSRLQIVGIHWPLGQEIKGWFMVTVRVRIGRQHVSACPYNCTFLWVFFINSIHWTTRTTAFDILVILVLNKLPFRPLHFLYTFCTLYRVPVYSTLVWHALLGCFPMQSFDAVWIVCWQCVHVKDWFVLVLQWWWWYWTSLQKSWWLIWWWLWRSLWNPCGIYEKGTNYLYLAHDKMIDKTWLTKIYAVLQKNWPIFICRYKSTRKVIFKFS